MKRNDLSVCCGSWWYKVYLKEIDARRPDVSVFQSCGSGWSRAGEDPFCEMLWEEVRKRKRLNAFERRGHRPWIHPWAQDGIDSNSWVRTWLMCGSMKNGESLEAAVQAKWSIKQLKEMVDLWFGYDDLVGLQTVSSKGHVTLQTVRSVSTEAQDALRIILISCWRTWSWSGLNDQTQHCKPKQNY